MNCPRPDPCESRCRCRCFLAVLTVLAVMVAQGIVAGHLYRKAVGRLAALEQKPAAPAQKPVDLSGITARLDSAEQHIAELAKMTHERRALLADELRKEIAAGESRLGRSIADLAVGGGLLSAEIRAESEARKEDIKEIRDRLGKLAVRVVEAWRSIADLASRVVALESRPAPAPVVVEKTILLPAYYYLYPARCR